jgi:hypothetical protein
MRALALALVALAACGPDFRMASRQLAAQAPPPREPIPERRAVWFDQERTRPRREWHVLILADNTTVAHGSDVQHFADGKLEHERAYRHGEPIGTWKSWWPNGHPRMEATYGTTEATPMRWWHENGQLSSEGSARNGLKEGEWTFWSATGVVAAKGRYVAGQREGEWSFFDDAGALTELAHYRADAKVERR